jgi:diguanylate cyclase (GGDEF)-like protein
MNQPADFTVKRGRVSATALGSAADALVMMVDDEPLVIELTQALLESAGYKRFVSTSDPRKAIALMQAERPHVVLLDIHMPPMSGFEVLSRMRADPLLQHVPAIVLTSAEDPETKLKALELGATDFLRKPVDESELALRLRNTLAAKAYQDYLAFYDRGTGLANRERFLDELERAVTEAADGKKTGAMLQFGLDRFKEINEALGPATGDLVLKEVARRIRAMLKSVAKAGEPRAQAARLSGDEFCVLLPAVAGVEHAARLAEALLRTLALPHKLDGKDLHVSASCGLALFPADGSDIDELAKNAAAALRQAKAAGRGSYLFYSKEFNAKAVQRLTIEAQLRTALARGELRLFYQPKVTVHDGRICGAEALLRWQQPERGLVPPNEFIPVAEDSGLIVPIGEWVLHAACKQLREWQAAGLPRVPIAVNVSPRQFQPQLVTSVREALSASGQAGYLRLELTESSVMSDPQSAIHLLGELQGLGMKLSIDDFGTGYSSLSYLQKLPLTELKIDRSFLSAIKPEASAAVLVDLIIAMAHSLGLTVVAEGVETQVQLDYLKKQGCDECQGFFFSKPLPAEEFAAKFLKHG